MQEVIFFGNGPLADYALEVIQPHFNIIFHAKTRSDLAAIPALKAEHPSALAILASFGVIIKPDLLRIFEPTGILNLHPSLLPKYRGPSPIETAILNGETTFGISIMKLVKAMDAGPIYYQTSQNFDLSTPKDTIYKELAHTGANWLVQYLAKNPTTNLPTPTSQASTQSPTNPPTHQDHTQPPTHQNHTKLTFNLPAPTPQDHTKATFCKMLDTSMSPLDPAHKTALKLNNQIRAFQGFPKSKFTFFGHDCTILSARAIENLPNQAQPTTPLISRTKKSLYLTCAPNHSTRTNTPNHPTQTSTPSSTPQDHTYLEILSLQPAGKKPMPTPAFLNGYAR